MRPATRLCSTIISAPRTRFSPRCWSTITPSSVATNPEFIKLLNEENLHRGRHIDPDLARQLNSPVVSALSEVLARGTASGVFRSDVDPQHLYITIASICYFPVSNRYTLSAIFKLQSDGDMLEDRRRQAIDVIFGYLRP